MNKYMFRFLFAGIVVILFSWAAPSAMITKDIIAKFWFTDLTADTISLYERILRISMFIVGILNVLYFIIAREERPHKKDSDIMNFKKETAHRYEVMNQHGLNKALYDFYSNDGYPKSEIRKALQNYPTQYPCKITIKDNMFECYTIHLDIEYQLRGFRRIKEDSRIAKEGFKEVWSSSPYRWYFRVMVILTILTILYVIIRVVLLIAK